jgi:hypothetical protein
LPARSRRNEQEPDFIARPAILSQPSILDVDFRLDAITIQDLDATAARNAPQTLALRVDDAESFQLLRKRIARNPVECPPLDLTPRPGVTQCVSNPLYGGVHREFRS